MKTSIRTIILAAATFFAAMSCQKEAAAPGIQDPSKTGETIQVNINASLGDLAAADETKATAKSVVRLEWADGDIVQAYCGSTKISGDDGLTVTPSENGLFASLTGTITPPNNGQTITLVYSNGCTAEGLDFDFSSQAKADGIPFVAYGTLVYDGSDSIEGKMVGFKFATSVMKIAATNLGGGSITGATITNINSKLTLTPKENGEPEIAGIAATGTSAGSISTTNIDAPSDGIKAIITVGLVPDNHTARSIVVNQTDYTNKGVITSAEIKGNSSYTTPASLFPCGTLDTHDYVLIAGIKWATTNLCAPNHGVEPTIGDYFQWGAYSGYVDNPNNGLLIYDRYNYPTGSEMGTFEMMNDGYEFGNVNSISPYWGTDAYTKYTDKGATLALTDDVANIIWGSTWRMPTSAEFQTLLEATYRKWDGEDHILYFYAPQSGDAGKQNEAGTGSYDKSNALLSFRDVGYGEGTKIKLYPTGESFYWSSTLYTGDGKAENANCLSISSYGASLETPKARCAGYPVRPVSD